MCLDDVVVVITGVWAGDEFHIPPIEGRDLGVDAGGHHRPVRSGRRINLHQRLAEAHDIGCLFHIPCRMDAGLAEWMCCMMRYELWTSCFLL